MTSNFRAGYIGLLGLPNAGKSTLINALVDEKLAGVSSKPQTTRNRIMGLVTTDEAQYIFIDAPGLVRADTALNKFLDYEFRAVIDESDVLLVHFNVDEDKKVKLDKLREMIEATGKPWIAIITKEDLANTEHRTVTLRMELEKSTAQKVITVSALKRPEETKEEVLSALLEFLPESPAPLYDPEMYTNMNLRDLVSEIIREKCFEILHHELPYSIAIRINLFEEKPKITRIFAEILVEKENHKKMVIGNGGETIKTIGSLARKDIEKLVDTKVFLDLKVSHRSNWSTNKRIMEELGYGIPQSKS